MKPILLLAVLAPIVSAGETQLFNGKDLTGWEGDPKFWSVQDEAITGASSPENLVPHNTFIVWKGGEPSDFTLTLKYRMTPGDEKKYTNSGIQYRSKVIDAEKFIVGGYQADFEYADKWSGILYEEKGRGILAKRGEQVVIKQGENPNKPKLEVTGKTGDPAEIQAAIKKDDWNEYKIIAKGNKVQHFINGRLTADVTDETAEAPKSGVIALQMHQGPPMKVQFKDITLSTGE
ncbi:DUF1080 domain-containing protein [Akkermansiaceae bacterium]|nr:DUF1080 domain-containing protein [Akkermansiaceae bacterium]